MHKQRTGMMYSACVMVFVVGGSLLNHNNYIYFNTRLIYARLHACTLPCKEHLVHSVPSVHECVVVDEYAKRLISRSFPHLVIRTWPIRCHDVAFPLETPSTVHNKDCRRYEQCCALWHDVYALAILTSSGDSEWSHRHSPCRCAATVTARHNKASWTRSFIIVNTALSIMLDLNRICTSF